MSEFHVNFSNLVDGTVVKNLPAMQKMWAQFLGGADPLKREMATHRSTLTWRSPWTEEPGRL